MTAPPVDASPTDPNSRFALPVEVARCLFCDSAPARATASGRDFEYASTPDTFDLMRCGGCGLVFIQPRPAPAAMSTIYPSNYYAYNEEEGEKPFVKFFRDRMEKIKVDRWRKLVADDRAGILDVGCGDGRLLEIIRRFGPQDWRIAGIEISAKAAASSRSKGFEIRTGDFEDLETAGWEERFQLALMHHVIEHLREPRVALRKVARMLKPGGVFSVETPDLRGWDYGLFRDRYWGGYHIPRHFYLFDSETLPRLLREEGFEILSVRSIPSPAFWVHSWHNWFIDRPWGKRFAPYCQPQNLFAIGIATLLEAIQLATRRQSSNLQVLARKISA